jgi:hydrogenase nickel incorporation protein HypB
MKTIEVKESITASNDRDAQALRERLSEEGLFLINLMSSPGSGKTTLLLKTIADLKDRLKIGVIEADIASDVDAVKIEEAGARSIQIHTDGMCHVDAGMTEEALREFDPRGLDLVFLENIGNLICPAEFDTGAMKNVMILSVPEGDDKPLKYPLMFQKSQVLLVTKVDTVSVFDFDFEKLKERVKRLNPDIEVFEVSAKTGESMDAWEDRLLSWMEEFRKR